MNKKDLINAIAERLTTDDKKVTKKAAEEMLDGVFGTITDALVAGNDVKISGFGNFVSAEVPERTGTIQMGDRKGETYVTPAHRAPKFKASSTLKKAVKGE